jgi:predicted deacetylase
MQAQQLLLSIHDVSPRFETEVDSHVDRFVRAGAGYSFAMLVVPDHWGMAPLTGNSSFGARLRTWAEQGVEMFVHGWFHRDMTPHERSLDRFKARHMTAGEGEFLGLDASEAARRMGDGRKLIEDITGRPVAGFIAPAWLYSDGARHALADCGFALAEDHMKVWSPKDGRTLAHGPVITWASRSKTRIASSLVAAAFLRHALRPTRTVRLAVHPGDIRVSALGRSIDKTLASLMKTHAPARYGDLLKDLA